LLLSLTSSRETFENIYLDLSKQPGKCRFAESGLGWKPSAGGETFTLDGSNIAGAQWSRASKGYELKIYSRSSGVIQLDGFEQEVSDAQSSSLVSLIDHRTLKELAKLSRSGTASHWRIRSMP
jgi:hypothetical protein